jgi:hypothetical protein
MAKISNLLIIVLCSIFHDIALNAQTPKCSFDSTSCFIKKKFNGNFKIQLEPKYIYNNKVSSVATPLLIKTNNDCTSKLFIGGNYENDIKTQIQLNSVYVIDNLNNFIINQVFTCYYQSCINQFVVLQGVNDYEIIVLAADIMKIQ